MTPQAQIVLSRLQHGGVTARYAFMYLGVGRLAARIYELRRAGYHIETHGRPGSGCYRLSKRNERRA